MLFQCPDNILKKIRVSLTRNVFPQFGVSYATCIGGCDDMFNNLMGIRAHCVRRAPELNDTGYGSNASARSNAPSANRPRERPTTARSAPLPVNQHQNRNQNQTNNNRSHDNSGSSWNSGGGSNSTGNQSRSANSWNNQSSTWNATATTSNNWNAPNQSSLNSSNTNFNLGNDNEGEIMCNCHQVAKQLTVRKDGPNQGISRYPFIRL